MKRVFVLALLPGIAYGQGLQSMSNDQLCVAFAETIISNEPYRQGMFTSYTQEALQSEITSRSDDCAPAESYLQAAQYSLQAKAEKSARKRAALIGVLSTYGNSPSAAPPQPMQRSMTTTHCRLVGQNLICEQY